MNNDFYIMFYDIWCYFVCRFYSLYIKNKYKNIIVNLTAIDTKRKLSNIPTRYVVFIRFKDCVDCDYVCKILKNGFKRKEFSIKVD